MFEAMMHEEYQIPEQRTVQIQAIRDNTQLLRELLIGEILTPNQEIVLKMLYEGPVRVYGTNDAITMDYCPTRLNIELDDERRIVNVSFG